MFRQLIESAPDAMIVVDKDGVIQMVNRQTEALFNYERKEIIGQSLEKLMPAGIDTRQKGYVEINAFTKIGSFPAEINFAETKIEKDILTIISVRDISQRKSAERKLTKSEKDFELLVTSVKDYSIFLIDTTGNVASWNSGAENIKGYTAEEIIGKPMDIFYTAEEVKKGEPKNNLRKAREKGHFETEGWRLRKDGSAFYADVTFTALIDNEGNLYGYAKVTRDITEQRRAEEHMRFLASIADNIQDPIISTDINLNITNWNTAAENLLEWKSEEVIGKSTAEILKIIYPYETGEQILQAYYENDFWQGEVIYYTKSGKALDVLATVSHLKDAEGNITGNLTLVRNITNRKKAERALSKLNAELEERVKERTEQVSKSEKRFKALVENNDGIITLMDENFETIYRSPSSERITGWSSEERKVVGTYEQNHPDDAAYLAEIMKNVSENPGKPFDITIRTKHKLGHYLWLEGVITNMINDPSVGAIVTNLRDITIQKAAVEALGKSEKLYRSLFENMLHGFAYCEAIREKGQLKDYIYLAVNNQYESLTGLKNITGKKISDIMPGLLESDPEYAETINRVVSTGRPEKFETYVKPFNKWLSIALYSPAREHFVGLINNITEQKLAEKKIKKINTELEERVIKRTEQLRRSNEELEAFSYSVSHDLRAPLRAIIGFTAMLEEDYLDKFDEEAKRITSVIKSNTIKMGQLIDDLLSFSRMGRQDILKSNIDAGELIKEIIADLNTKDNNIKRVDWTIHPLPLIKADINTIRQVWINLISNAIKYSSNVSKPKIEIGSFSENGAVVFSIRDNGIGFDERYKNKLFKVFQRLHTTAEFEGTGIGLAIVDKIVSKHGGKVWAEAKVNEGACFYFSIPNNDRLEEDI